MKTQKFTVTIQIETRDEDVDVDPYSANLIATLCSEALFEQGFGKQFFINDIEAQENT